MVTAVKQTLTRETLWSEPKRALEILQERVLETGRGKKKTQQKKGEYGMVQGVGKAILTPWVIMTSPQPQTSGPYESPSALLWASIGDCYPSTGRDHVAEEEFMLLSLLQTNCGMVGSGVASRK